MRMSLRAQRRLSLVWYSWVTRPSPRPKVTEQDWGSWASAAQAVACHTPGEGPSSGLPGRHIGRVAERPCVGRTEGAACLLGGTAGPVLHAAVTGAQAPSAASEVL